MAFRANEKFKGPMVAVDRRLYLTKEGKLAEVGDPKAVVLLAGGPGAELPKGQLDALGYEPKADKPKRGRPSSK